MNNNILILIILNFAPLFLGAQNFKSSVQYGYGSNGWDQSRSAIQTSDEGFIICSQSNGGISGDKSTNNYGSSDVWVIKTDKDGNIEWQKSYGGSDVDNPYAFIQTKDGNYLIAVTSASGISGNES